MLLIFNCPGSDRLSIAVLEAAAVDPGTVRAGSNWGCLQAVLRECWAVAAILTTVSLPSERGRFPLPGKFDWVYCGGPTDGPGTGWLSLRYGSSLGTEPNWSKAADSLFIFSQVRNNGWVRNHKKMIDLIVVCVLCGCCSGLGFAFEFFRALVCGLSQNSQKCTPPGGRTPGAVCSWCNSKGGENCAKPDETFNLDAGALLSRRSPTDFSSLSSPSSADFWWSWGRPKRVKSTAGNFFDNHGYNYGYTDTCFIRLSENNKN